MPRNFVTYKESVDYKRYIAGEDGKRWEKLPAFEIVDNVVQLPVGEVFCRVPGPKGLCYQTSALNPNNLRAHLKSVHKKVVPTVHKGATGAMESVATEEYYQKVMLFLDGKTESWPGEPPAKEETSKKKAAKVVAAKPINLDELALPRYKKGTINWAQAKKNVLAAGAKSCQYCIDHVHDCFQPDALDDTHCEVWGYYLGEIIEE